MDPTPTQPSAPIVWRKGWVYPSLFAVVSLLVGLAFVGAGRELGGSAVGVISLGVLFLMVAVGAAASAVRRKLTMTQDTLVIRTLWRTTELPLARITQVRQDRGDNGVFAMKAVRVHTADTSIATKSFGIHQNEGIRLITEAATAQGAQLLGWNAEREPRPPEGR